jgi:hypothetical protein
MGTTTTVQLYDTVRWSTLQVKWSADCGDQTYNASKNALWWPKLQGKWTVECGDQHYTVCDKRYSAVINIAAEVNDTVGWSTVQCKWILEGGVQYTSACDERYSTMINTTVQVKLQCGDKQYNARWRMVSSGLLRRVALVRTDVSEEPGASFHQGDKNRCTRNNTSCN